ncbi:putative integrase, partial [Acidianus sp. RZ1]|uniref:putative integrase n=1 Tax=Acidianus sp. RZ1 TaxID=1540082 RepID=UPI001492DA1F
MTEKKTYYNFEGIIIRQKKGRYYVCKLENVNADVRETYVAPLIDVIKSYEKLKMESGVWGYLPE